MKRIIQIIFLFISLNGFAGTNLISYFSWDTDVTIADFGPNAIAVSSSSVSDINGASGTKGLNAGLPKQDIELDFQQLTYV